MGHRRRRHLRSWPPIMPSPQSNDPRHCLLGLNRVFGMTKLLSKPTCLDPLVPKELGQITPLGYTTSLLFGAVCAFHIMSRPTRRTELTYDS
jgi:hypothetical protein